MRTILAIDQSTSATKAIVFDQAGRLVGKFGVEHKPIYPRPGWVEHDAAEIWRNTRAALEHVLARAEAPVCLSITNQRETLVVFDRATGEPLHNAIVWECRRGDGVCEELRRGGHESLVARKTGLRIDGYFSAPKLAALMRDQPEIAARLAGGEALFGTIDTYLIYRLTGGKVFATDHTNASRTLLFDIQRLRWDEELCGLFGVPMRCLAEVRDSTGEYGVSEMGSLAIRGVMGDSQASLLAHGCVKPGMGKVTLGSGSSVLLNIGPAVRDAGEGAVSTVAWTHGGKAVYSFEGIISYSAATIGWLKDQLGLIQSAAETEAAAASVLDNGGVYLVPAFAGLSAPYWSPRAKAAIVGLTASANRNHVIRAALESIAYQIHDVLTMMSGRAEVELAAIHADGGASRNGFLMQFIADITGRPIVAARLAECSPLGAALAGAVGMGVYGSLDETAGLARETLEYGPKMGRDEAAALYGGWKRAVGQVLAGVG